jgi:RNA polymerase sigma factor (sigma-70 family)
MQTHSNTEGSSVLEELILSCIPWVEKLAHKYARISYRVELEELYSIGMARVCELAASVDTRLDAVPYMCKAAQYAMVDELRRICGCETVSLDAPLFDDSPMTLADELSSPVSVSSRPSKRVRAVRRSVKQLSEKQRLVLFHLYGFSGYGYSAQSGTARALDIPEGTVASTGNRARRKLRQDERLCKAVGVQVEGQARGELRSLARSRYLGRVLRQRKVEVGV